MIFGHAKLIDVDGEPLVIRTWMPDGESKDTPIDWPSFLLLVEEVTKAWLRRARRVKG